MECEQAGGKFLPYGYTSNQEHPARNHSDFWAWNFEKKWSIFREICIPDPGINEEGEGGLAGWSRRVIKRIQ
jgi:hypothetical protein